jgi:acyl carrier protein
LGFLQNGDLFVAGRTKDLIIIRGNNHYPQDIEQTVEQCHEFSVSGGCAAFAIDTGDEEQLVVVQEIEAPKTCDVDPMLTAVRQAVIASHDVQVSAVVFVRAKGVPKTTSGKVRRHACREAFLNNELDTIHCWKRGLTADDANRNGDAHIPEQIAKLVLQVVDEIAGNRAVGSSLDTTFAELEFDSAERVDLYSSVESRFGIRFEDDLLPELHSIRDVARVVATLTARH